MTTIAFASRASLARFAAVLLAAGAVLASARVFAQDASAGDKLFARCKACHQVGENARNGIGPQLNGIIGMPAAAQPGYRYSDALKAAHLTWDAATLRQYLQKPSAKVPGTKMIFPGLTTEKDQADLVAYLELFGPDGKSKPKP